MPLSNEEKREIAEIVATTVSATIKENIVQLDMGHTSCLIGLCREDGEILTSIIRTVKETEGGIICLEEDHRYIKKLRQTSEQVTTIAVRTIVTGLIGALLLGIILGIKTYIGDIVKGTP